MSGASHTSQASKLVCHVIFHTEMECNQQRVELHVSSVYQAESPSQLHTPKLLYIPSQHWMLLIWCDTDRSYELARCLLVARTTCSIGKNDAQHTTCIPSRRFSSHAESCLTRLETSDPDSSIASVRVHRLLGNSDTDGMAKNI